jgi:ABC-2 type transport system permease protein
MNPLRGLAELSWLEIKIFLREPLGAIGTIIVPVLAFIVFGRVAARGATLPSLNGKGLFGPGAVPALVCTLIAISAVLSLATIISIYREGGILKRLRATPLRPHTILIAHVLVKLLLTATTMTLTIIAGKQYFTVGPDVPVFRFGVALLISTGSILSIGFVMASLVPTARFAQPIGAVILYPMFALSGLFVPIAALPPALQSVAKVSPLTYTVRLLQGVWNGDPWSAHGGDLGALALVFVVCTAISSRVFRWE